MKAKIEIINIKWEGPLTSEEVYEKNDASDKGVYQIYGDHPVYGRDVLLYIGQTMDTFGTRLRTHDRDFKNWEQKIEICLGRIYTEKKARPSDEEWRILVDRVEKLLIPACWPADNRRTIGGPSNPDEVKDLLVLNWGRFRSLPATVSGRQAGIGSLDRNAQAIGSTKSS